MVDAEIEEQRLRLPADPVSARRVAPRGTSAKVDRHAIAANELINPTTLRWRHSGLFLLDKLFARFGQEGNTSCNKNDLYSVRYC